MSTGARGLGITIGSLRAGVHDAITDVDGVLVGHTTLVEGDGPLVVGKGPVRTGVSVVLPHSLIWRRPVFAGIHRLNGNGELTGTHWIEESGLLSTAIGLTNTHSVGVVRDALVREHFRVRGADHPFWSMPVVGETWDGVLNDLNGHHVTADHVAAALRSASGGPVAQGAVGGGTGMVCHDFKGGIGSASRIVAEDDGGYTVGVLVQANHGRRERLTIDGVPVGREIPFADVPPPRAPRTGAGGTSGSDGASTGGAASTDGSGAESDGPSISAGAGSIIVILATDAPLLPHQCKRLAQRAALGIGRTGGTGEHYSGDLFLAFATGNRTLEPDVMGATPPHERALRMLDNQYITALFDAAIEATEAAIVNALVSAETTTGRDGITAHAIPTDRLVALLAQRG